MADPRASEWSKAIERNAVRPDGIGSDHLRQALGISARRWESIFNPAGRTTATRDEAEKIGKALDNIGRVNALFTAGIDNGRSERRTAKLVGQVVTADPSTKDGRKLIAEALSGAKGKVGLGVPASGPKAVYLRGRKTLNRSLGLDSKASRRERHRKL